MLAQRLTNRNNNDTGSNHNEEEHNDDEQSKSEKLKESSSIDAKVLKGTQAQFTSLSQRDELKKAGMTHLTHLNGIQSYIRQSLNRLLYIRMMVKSPQTSISITSSLRLVMS